MLQGMQIIILRQGRTCLCGVFKVVVVEAGVSEFKVYQMLAAVTYI